jgi:hypothetical protein
MGPPGSKLRNDGLDGYWFASSPAEAIDDPYQGAPVTATRVEPGADLVKKARKDHPGALLARCIRHPLCLFDNATRNHGWRCHPNVD